MTENAALHAFAARHGFDPGLLLGDDRYAVEGAGAGFEGRVAAIRLVERGRFGNVFHQILHAAMLARQLDIGTVRLFPFQGGPPPGRRRAGGLDFVVGDPAADAVPTLVGHFFNSYAFQSALSGYPDAWPPAIIDEVMRPLFAHLRPAEPAADCVTLNFRGGDVFSRGAVPAEYVQPPASYYVRAALFSRDAYATRTALLVSEDDANPALPIVAHRLAEAGMTVRHQRGSFAEDIAVLLGAVHLVSPFGTLCEALAMLAPQLRSYTAFRQFESHRHLHAGRPSLLLQVLRAHGVQPIRLTDPGLSYIPPLAWANTPEQRELLCRFPAARLRLDLPADTTDDACRAAFPPSRLDPPATEGFALRRRLLDLHATHAETRRVAAVAEADAAAALQAAAAQAADDVAAAERRIAAAERAAQTAGMQLQAAQSQLQAARQDAVAARAEAWRAQAAALALRASRSWRLTAPLRALGRRVRRRRAAPPDR